MRVQCSQSQMSSVFSWVIWLLLTLSLLPQPWLPHVEGMRESQIDELRYDSCAFSCISLALLFDLQNCARFQTINTLTCTVYYVLINSVRLALPCRPSASQERNRTHVLPWFRELHEACFPR